MQKVSCYNCGENKNTLYATENGFNLVKCDNCGLLYVNPRPDNDEISESHKLGVHRGDENINVTGHYNTQKISNYMNLLEDLYGGEGNISKTWLDIGCGYGEFLLSLKRYSDGAIAAKGVEPNMHKKNYAINKGLDVNNFDLDKHNEQYDVISMLNVFSHLPDPPTSIKELKRLLKPNGELLIETGDTASLSSNDHHKPFYLPDHLSFASEEILVNILNKTGFDIIDTKKYPFVKFTFYSLAKEVIKLFIPNKVSNLIYLLKYKKYGKTDMYIRARLRN